MNIGIINSHMYGRDSEPGEHVDWSTPDVADEEEWRDLLEMNVQDFAATSPHMIVFYVEDDQEIDDCPIHGEQPVIRTTVNRDRLDPSAIVHLRCGHRVICLGPGEPNVIVPTRSRVPRPRRPQPRLSS